MLGRVRGQKPLAVAGGLPASTSVPTSTWWSCGNPAGRPGPIVDVEAAIRAACRRWRVLENRRRPFRWARSLQLLDGEGLPVLEYPQSPGRMAPATARFYEAVVNGALTHSGDSRLARHVGNVVLREDAAAPGWPRNAGTRPAASTQPWPPSWPTTGPPPWPAPPATASTSKRATTPGASQAPGVVGRTRLGRDQPGLRAMTTGASGRAPGHRHTKERQQRGRRYLHTGERPRPWGATGRGRSRPRDINGPGVLPAGAVRRA